MTPLKFDIKMAESFRDVLVAEFERRKERRSAYSLRAYARDLGVKPTSLSGIFKGRDGISRTTAEEIAKRLSMSAEQSAYFLDLVESQHSRTALGREQAKKRLQAYHKKICFEELKGNTSSLFDEWYYTAVLELITLNHGNVDIERFAKSLKISRSEVKKALVSLENLGTISASADRFVRNKFFLKAKSATPSTTLRKFHKQLLKMGSQAIDDQSIEERKMLNSIISVDKRRLNEARDWLTKMHEEFMSEFATSENATSVYGFGLQLFKIAEEQK